MEISIDNQHVTKSLQRYRFLPKQPKENTEKISLDSYCMDVPMLVFAAWLVQELVRVSSRTFCGCLRTKTVSSPNFSPRSALPLGSSKNFHCFHHEWELLRRTSNCSRLFQKIFKYTLYITISVNIVLYSSKDWSFNQNLAYLWSFLSISAFVSIIFRNFVVKQQNLSWQS